MKELYKATTTSSIIAVIVIVGCFGYFYLAGSGLFKSPESLQTQITQGLFGLAMAIMGYYFGASKEKHTPTTTESITKTTTNNEQ